MSTAPLDITPVETGVAGVKKYNPEILAASKAEQAEYGEQVLGWSQQEKPISGVFKELVEGHSHTGRALHSSTELHKVVAEITDKIAQAADHHSPDGPKAVGIVLTVLRTEVENATILRHHESPESYVQIFTGILAALKEHFGILKEGHVAFLIGHELGHLKRGNYEIAQSEAPKDPNYTVIDSVEVTAGKRLLEALAGRAFTRKQEFECDALALTWMADAGYDPAEGVEVLQFLLELSKKDGPEDTKLKKNDSLNQVLCRSILKTHPATPSRISQGKSHVKKLESERERGDNPLSKEASNEITALSQELLVSRRQLLSHAVAPCIRPESINWETLNAIRDGKSDLGVLSIEEQGHLLTVVQAKVRILHGQMPFVPLGWLREEARRIVNTKENT